MIAKAIHELGDLRSGSSSIAIGKYIKSTYPTPADFNRRLKFSLNNGEKLKYLTRIRNSYKLTDKGSRVLLSKRDQKSVSSPVKRAVKKTPVKKTSVIKPKEKREKKEKKEKKKKRRKSLQNVVALVL